METELDEVEEETQEPMPVAEKQQHESYINQEEALEKLLKAADLNITLVWMAATMSVIAAINSLDGPTALVKGLIFMIIGGISLFIYNKRYKKEKE